MKKVTLFIAIISLLSCKTGRQEKSNVETGIQMRDSVNLNLTPLKMDSISVRALEYRDRFWFAGSRSTYGKTDMSGKTLIQNTIDSLENPLEFRSIAVTDNSTFILNAGAPALIYKISREGGQPVLVYKEDTEGVFYDSLEFWDDQEGVAFGDPTAQGDNKCISILKTVDGGKTWKKISCDKIPEFIDGEAGFAASNSNISVKGDNIWIATGGKAARVLHSTDKGESWIAQKTPIISGGEMTGIFAMDFYDENLGVIIGGDWSQKTSNSQNKAITIDGGKTWTLMSEGKGPGYCSDIAFVPDTDGKELLAVGSPGVWWSGNRGKTWLQLTTEGFYTVAFKNRTSGMLMGYAKASSFELN